MRGLDLFSEESIGRYYAIAIRNKVAQILGPAVLPKPAAKAKPKPKAIKRRAREPAARMAA